MLRLAGDYDSQQQQLHFEMHFLLVCSLRTTTCTTDWLNTVMLSLSHSRLFLRFFEISCCQTFSLIDLWFRAAVAFVFEKKKRTILESFPPSRHTCSSSPLFANFMHMLWLYGFYLNFHLHFQSFKWLEEPTIIQLSTYLLTFNFWQTYSKFWPFD